jgi:hypothetical protein
MLSWSPSIAAMSVGTPLLTRAPAVALAQIIEVGRTASLRLDGTGAVLRLWIR